MTLNIEVLTFVSGLIVGGWLVYTQLNLWNLNHKVSNLEDEVSGFPSPEELALQIVKTKLPISSLPDDMKEKIRGAMANPSGDGTGPVTTLPPQGHGTSYIG